MVDRKSVFVVAMEIAYWTSEMSDEKKARGHLLGRAGEAIYTIWLNVFSPLKVNQDLLILCPYKSGTLDWQGTCSHSCLLEGTRLQIDRKAQLATSITSPILIYGWRRYLGSSISNSNCNLSGLRTGKLMRSLLPNSK